MRSTPFSLPEVLVHVLSDEKEKKKILLYSSYDRFSSSDPSFVFSFRFIDDS
jgi:hypothetical protein